MNDDGTQPVFPFAALVGQGEMKLALLLNVIDARIGGVMIQGLRGTAKSTAVRGLADLMPPLEVVEGCPYNAPPGAPCGLCSACTTPDRSVETVPVPVVDLPLGATEDRVVGSLDLEAALIQGAKSFEPGLLARAHRGFLYIDEVNLLEDHLVDLLLDVAAAGVNIVERESLSVRHPARFVLIGSGNPEEGELRPQLQDRFGLSVTIGTEDDLDDRVEITRRRLAFDADATGFRESYRSEAENLRDRLVAARTRLEQVQLSDDHLVAIARLNDRLQIDGHRGELTTARAATALAAWEERDRVEDDDVRRTAPLALRHRLRRDPLETRDLSHRIEEAMRELFETGP